MDYKVISRLLAKPYLAIGATLFLCFLLFSPSDNFEDIPVFPNADKLAHLLAFSGLSFLWYNYLKNTFLIIALVLIFAILTEIIQAILPISFYRSGDVKDVLADFLGIVLGVFVAKFVNKFLIKALS